MALNFGNQRSLKYFVGCDWGSMTLPLGIFSCTRQGPCSEPAALVMQLQSTGYLHSPVIALSLLSPHWFLLVLCNMFTGPEYLDTAQTAPVQTISHLCRPISFFSVHTVLANSQISRSWWLSCCVGLITINDLTIDLAVADPIYSALRCTFQNCRENVFVKIHWNNFANLATGPLPFCVFGYKIIWKRSNSSA